MLDKTKAKTITFYVVGFTLYSSVVLFKHKVFLLWCHARAIITYGENPIVACLVHLKMQHRVGGISLSVVK